MKAIGKHAWLGVAAALALCGCRPSDDCQVPDQSCAEEPGHYRVCIQGSSGDVPFSPVGNSYDIYECPGIEPVCKPLGRRDHVCEDKQPPEPCNSEPRELLTLAYAERSRLLDVVDIDGDQRPDLLLACADAQGHACGLWVSRQAADGSFGAPEELDRMGMGFRDQRIADVDGDGFVDLAVEWGSDPNQLLMPHTLDLMLGSAHGFELVTSHALDEYDRLGAVADLDADGRAEIVLNTGFGAAVLSYADGALAERTRFEIARDPVLNPYAQPTAISVIDFYATGKPYLFVAVDGTYYQVFRADGDAYVPVPEASGWISPSASPSPVIADFDHDGASDILTAAGYATRPAIGVQTSNRDGTFTPHAGATLPYTAASFAADVDGDGDLDGVFVHGGGRLSVALGDGHGALPTARTFAFDDEGRIEQSFVVDIDGDGRADLVEATTDAASDPVPAPSPIHIRAIAHACL